MARNAAAVPASASGTRASAMNPAGEVVGIALFPGERIRGVVWSGGTVRELLPADRDTWAEAVTDDGTVLGTLGETPAEPYRWTASGSGRALPLPDGYKSGKVVAAAGEWAVGVVSPAPVGASTKPTLTDGQAPVRWNLRTGTVELLPAGFTPQVVALDGTAAGYLQGFRPVVLRDGALVGLPRPGMESGVQGISADGRTLTGFSDTPVVWTGC
jgi:hypothetical protein